MPPNPSSRRPSRPSPRLPPLRISTRSADLARGPGDVTIATAHPVDAPTVEHIDRQQLATDHVAIPAPALGAWRRSRSAAALSGCRSCSPGERLPDRAVARCGHSDSLFAGYHKDALRRPGSSMAGSTPATAATGSARTCISSRAKDLIIIAGEKYAPLTETAINRVPGCARMRGGLGILDEQRHRSVAAVVETKEATRRAGSTARHHLGNRHGHHRLALRHLAGPARRGRGRRPAPRRATRRLRGSVGRLMAVASKPWC